MEDYSTSSTRSATVCQNAAVQTIGLDIANSIFSAHGFDVGGRKDLDVAIAAINCARWRGQSVPVWVIGKRCCPCF